jgi:uncharacterized protein (TIGR02453 family)
MFTNKSLSFLRSLKRNNKREWFHERRAQYDQHCRQPVLEIIERLADDMPAIAPEMVIDPKVNLLRPFRDTRFSEDKTPLKTHVGATIPHKALGRMNGAWLYFEVAPRWVWIGGGMWRPDTSQLHLVREHVAANHRQLEDIVTSPRFRKIGGLQGDTMTRVPRGFAKDHPAATYLMHRQFMGFREAAATLATQKNFYARLRDTFETIMPLVRFLNEPLLDALKTERRSHIFEDPVAREERLAYRAL